MAHERDLHRENGSENGLLEKELDELFQWISRLYEEGDPAIRGLVERIKSLGKRHWIMGMRSGLEEAAIKLMAEYMKRMSS